MELPDLIDQILPAVVQIITPTGQGTGFVINEKDGLIVTNKHVVEFNTFVQVVTNDGRKFYGQVVASDPHIDLSVLYVNETFPKALKLSDSSNVRLGESVIAIGHPYGYDYTISQGIISSKGRKNVGPTFRDVEFFQLDMGINPGNSGGPVMKRDSGEVVGMVTLGVREADNIGFAVPSNYDREFLSKIATMSKTDAIDSTYCSVCGNMEKKDAKYCSRCGSTIEKISLDKFIASLPENAGKVEKSPIEIGDKKKCPNCETLNEKTDRYCKKCGTVLQ